MQSYDYAHRQGVEKVSWDQFAAWSAKLAEGLASFQVEAVVGLARASLFPAASVALALRRMLYPAACSRRVDDRVQFHEPVWRVDISPEVAGKVVAVVDEIADTGATLALAAWRARQLGARQVVTACLVRHSWADPAPDLAAHVSDALVVFPWDRQVYQAGRWQPHPEIEAALSAQPLESRDQEEVVVVPAAPEDGPVLRRLMELYLYDFSEYDQAELNEHGLYGYPYLDHYWTDPDRYPFLIRIAGNLAGFALVRDHTWSDGQRAHDMAEFFVIRKYRRQNVGRRAAVELFGRFPGLWRIGQVAANLPALVFWRQVISAYAGGYREAELPEWDGPLQEFTAHPHPGAF